jgi:hypothetical protein
MTRRALVTTLTWIHAWGNDALWVVAAVSALLFLYSAFYASPNARLIAAQQRHDAAVQESRAFCKKHGIPFGTRTHTLCAADLVDIRANEHRRILDESGTF